MKNGNIHTSNKRSLVFCVLIFRLNTTTIHSTLAQKFNSKKATKFGLSNCIFKCFRQTNT